MSRLVVPVVVLVVVFALTACGGGTSTTAQPLGAGVGFHPVAGKFKPDDTKLDRCNENTRCLEQAFGNLAYENGPKPTLALFERKMNEDKAVESDCHRIAHMIGSASLARNHGNVARTFAQGAATCWSGYYHGILERAFFGITTPAGLGRVARKVCDDSYIRQNTYLYYQCVHGLGHGLMLQTGYNMPLALDICSRLATAWDQTSCSGGVFMENISSSYGFHSQWLKAKDLVYPCDSRVVKNQFKVYCYLMVTSRILQANGYNWKKAARICAHVEKDWVGTCFQSYGRDASGFTRQNPRRILELCTIAGSVGRSDCIYGASRDMTSNYAGGRQASGLCTLAPAGDRARCFNGIGTILGSLHASESGRRSACAELTKQYLTACLRGAAVLA